MGSHTIATPEQHAHEFEALALTQHPTVKEAYERVRESWLAATGPGPRAGLLRRRIRRGDVLGGGLVAQPGPAAPEGDLHFAPRARARRGADPRVALGDR